MAEQTEANWQTVANEWDATYKALVAAEWGDLTPGDLTQIAGSKNLLLERIAYRCFVRKPDADKQVTAWFDGLTI